MIVSLLTHKCVTRPQWVNEKKIISCYKAVTEIVMLCIYIDRRWGITQNLHQDILCIQWIFKIYCLLRDIHMIYTLKCFIGVWDRSISQIVNYTLVPENLLSLSSIPLFPYLKFIAGDCEWIVFVSLDLNSKIIIVSKPISKVFL